MHDADSRFESFGLIMYAGHHFAGTVQQRQISQFASDGVAHLVEADRKTPEFERRVNAFKAEKAKILANAQLSEPEQLASIEGLRNREFRENEHFLLHAYEQQ